MYCHLKSYSVLQYHEPPEIITCFFSVSLSVSFCMFPCSKCYFIRAYLDTIWMSLLTTYYSKTWSGFWGLFSWSREKFRWLCTLSQLQFCKASSLTMEWIWTCRASGRGWARVSVQGVLAAILHVYDGGLNFIK